MSDMAVIAEVVALLQVADTESALTTLLHDVSKELGFEHFALIHHVDLRKSSPSIVHIDTYPNVWREHFVQHKLYVDDPVLYACMRTHVGFSWDDISNFMSLSSVHRNILESASKAGIGDGFTVPINITGEANGSCSFATRIGKAACASSFILAQLVGSFAFQAARQLKRNNGLLMPNMRRRLVGIDAQILALRRFVGLVRTGHFAKSLFPRDPYAKRVAMTLRVNDALADGASHRQIGLALFGRTAVDSDWSGQSDFLKSRVRRLVALAHSLAGGGWRNLLNG